MLEQIREAAHEVQRPVFYAIGIIITAYLPIFTLQRVEGRLFKPMAWTVAFALLGALIFSMLLAPVLASFLFRRSDQGMAQPGAGVPDRRVYRGDWCAGRSARAGSRVGVARRCAWRSRSVWPTSGVIGSEFLPHLDEGAIWVRGTLAPSTGPTEGNAVDRTRRA